MTILLVCAVLLLAAYGAFMTWRNAALHAQVASLQGEIKRAERRGEIRGSFQAKQRMFEDQQRAKALQN